MKLRPFGRALTRAVALIATAAVGLTATTNAFAAKQSSPSARPGSAAAHRAAAGAPAVVPAVVPDAYGGNDDQVMLQALRDQTSFRFDMKWEVSGAPAKELLDMLADSFSGFPGFVPQTNSASFAASTKDNKTYTVEITGAYQRPGREKEVFKIGDNTLTQWVIGREVTIQYNKEKPLKKTLDANDDPFSYFAFVILWDNGFWNWNDKYFEDQVLSCSPYDDTVNDLSVDSCDFNVTTKGQLSDLLSVFSGGSITKVDDAAADLYLANDLAGAHGAPVEFKLQVTGKDDKNKAAKLSFSMDVTDLNKKTVTVDAGK